MLRSTLACALVLCLVAPLDAAELEPTSRFGDAFWAHWGDGLAEIATYDLVFTRYGAAREGTAVAIFVTETFDGEQRVKSDDPRRPGAFPVMKLNLVEDFPTGIYDYNLMTSTFVALTERDGRPRGHTTKITHSMQEWCGHTWVQFVFDRAKVQYELHSYFDGEADRSEVLEASDDAITEDGLMLWARELAGPFLAPGASTTRPLLDAAKRQRIEHAPPRWRTATLQRATGTHIIEVPAGSFEVQERRVAIESEVVWRFDVEVAAPHRLVRWENAMGQRGELVAVQRLPYWRMNAPDGAGALESIGLQPRPARTP
jgi:hypothetical protein